MNADDEEVPVSDTDELTVVGGPHTDRTRRVGEYKRANAPLSAVEIEERKRLGQNWVPRTTENIGEIEPIPEEPAPS